MDEPIFSPTDIPNFITYKNYQMYCCYALAVTPLLLKAGGRPIFAGNRIATIAGKSPSEVWMVVRYPDHRTMLRMISNRYYSLINGLRERGVAKFEAAFTQARNPKSALPYQKEVLVFHVDTNRTDLFFSSIRQLIDGKSLKVVYESEVRLHFNFFVNLKPSDGNPPTYPITVAFGADDTDELLSFAKNKEVLALLNELCNMYCIQLYEKADVNQYLKFRKPKKSDVISSL